MKSQSALRSTLIDIDFGNAILAAKGELDELDFNKIEELSEKEAAEICNSAAQSAVKISEAAPDEKDAKRIIQRLLSKGHDYPASDLEELINQFIQTSESAQKLISNSLLALMIEVGKAPGFSKHYSIKIGEAREKSNKKFEEFRLNLINYIEKNKYRKKQNPLNQKKTYRARSELPDPTKRADSDVNRLRKNFQVRVLPDLRAQVDHAAKKAGLTRQEWVEQAFLEKLKRTPE